MTEGSSEGRGFGGKDTSGADAAGFAITIISPSSAIVMDRMGHLLLYLLAVRLAEFRRFRK